MKRVIITHASAATVYRWATSGPRRRRRKYRNAITLCRVVAGRYGVIMGTDENGDYGDVGKIRVSYGFGHVRDCGPSSYWTEGLEPRAAIRYFGVNEARPPRCEEHSERKARKIGWHA